MKRDKVLCSMFLFAIWGVDPAQNLAKYKRWFCVLRTTNQEKYEVHTVSVKRKSLGPSYINLSLFACCFDVYRTS